MENTAVDPNQGVVYPTQGYTATSLPITQYPEQQPVQQVYQPVMQGYPGQVYYQPVQYQQIPVQYGAPQGQPMQVPPQYYYQPVPQQPNQEEQDFDYSYVHDAAQVALYDDFLSEPRIIMVQPAPTADFIGKLASTIYQNASLMGGTISYSIILQMTENFIHARFSEMVVSVFNNGKTIRFADKGPGFKNKDHALQPGFTSATQPMKRYIKGVGSGLPTVKEWLQINKAGGKIIIEDNLDGGAVVTISVNDEVIAATPAMETAKKPTFYMPTLTEKEKTYILLLANEGALGISEISSLSGKSKSTVHTDIKRLEEAGVVQNEPGTKRRMLSDLGVEVAKNLK